MSDAGDEQAPVQNPPAGGGGNPLQAMGWETRSLSLKYFTGKEDPTEWIRRFELVAGKFQWSDQEKLFRFEFYMDGSAGPWLRALSDDRKIDYESLKAEFEAHYIKGESPIVLESQLAATKLKADQSIDDYLAAVLDLGSRLNRTPENLAVSFLNGLSENMKEFCV